VLQLSAVDGGAKDANGARRQSPQPGVSPRCIVSRNPGLSTHPEADLSFVADPEARRRPLDDTDVQSPSADRHRGGGRRPQRTCRQRRTTNSHRGRAFTGQTRHGRPDCRVGRVHAAQSTSQSSQGHSTADRVRRLVRRLHAAEPRLVAVAAVGRSAAVLVRTVRASHVRPARHDSARLRQQLSQSVPVRAHFRQVPVGGVRGRVSAPLLSASTSGRCPLRR